MLLKMGQQLQVGGVMLELVYINEGRQRFTFTPVNVKAGPKVDAEGKFIDDRFLNGDPVWAIYQNDAGEWIETGHPQTVFNYAYGDRIAIAGEDPFLYGYHFASKADLFMSRQEALDECARRNSIKSTA